MKTIYYILSTTWKEIQVILRDRGWLMILFLLPLLVGGFIGGMNLAANPPSAEGEDEAGILLRVGLINLDTGIFGSEVSKAMKDIIQFEMQEYSDIDEAVKTVALGDNTAVVIIPADFSDKINSYESTNVEVIVDPAEPEGASIVTGIINQVMGEVTLWGEVQHGVHSIFEQSGLLAQASPQEKVAIEAQNLGVIMTRINEMRRDPAILVVSEDLQGAKIQGGIELFIAHLFAGLTVMFIFFIVAMSSNSMLVEREAGTIRRLLTATAPRGTILAGKILAFMLLGCLQVVVMFSVANLLLGVPLGRSPESLVVITIAVTFVAAAMGMMVAALAKSASQANSIGLILAFVLAGLGGAMVTTKEPVLRLSGGMSTVARFTPHAYAVEAYYRVMVENAGLTLVLPLVGIVLAFGVVFFLIAVWRFKFET